MKSFGKNNPDLTVINSVARFSGEIKGFGRIEVWGFVNGKIQFDGDVNIEPGGRVEGNILANNLLVNGSVVGNTKVFNRLSLGKSSKMQGDADINKLLIEEGAVYCGRISMKGEGERKDQ
ncbi:MAG: polymer-forming cytoskeletal protein [bacterium]|nr:polymer-forming cytoskeletal protein [bacterium]